MTIKDKFSLILSIILTGVGSIIAVKAYSIGFRPDWGTGLEIVYSSYFHKTVVLSVIGILFVKFGLELLVNVLKSNN